LSLPRTASDQSPGTGPSSARWLAEEVRPHEAHVRGYLRHQFPDVDADDVVQESYLKLLQHEAGGRILSAKAYFFSVARNTALKVFRRRRIFSSVAVNELPDWRVLDGGPDAIETINARQRLELVADAVDQLPARCREIIRLALVAGLTTADIAKQLGIAESTVRVQMARGIKKCAAYLRERDDVK